MSLEHAPKRVAFGYTVSLVPNHSHTKEGPQRFTRGQQGKTTMRARRAVAISIITFSTALGAGAAEPAKSAAEPKSAAPLAASAKAPKASAAGNKAAKPDPKTITIEPKGVEFGMTVEGLAKVYDRWWDEHYLPEYNKTNPGPKMKELDYQVEQRKALFRRVKAFEGYPDSFDKSALKGEFARSNGEAMTWAKLPAVPGKVTAAGGATPAKPAVLRRFFFYKGRMWKIYDEYKLEQSSPYGGDFDSAVKTVSSDLGRKGRRLDPSEGTLTKDSIEFDDGKTLLRLVNLDGGKVAVVRADKAMATEVVKSRERVAVRDESALDSDVQSVLR
jgi:hypothetical protein